MFSLDLFCTAGLGRDDEITLTWYVFWLS